MLFKAAGSPPSEAETVANLLVSANLAGHDSHGVVRVPQYLRNVRRGRVVPGRENTVLSDQDAVVCLSANFGYGQTASLSAVRLAVERADRHGAAAVGVAEMNHNGRLSDYALEGGKAGMVTMVFAASGGFNAMVAPFGGSERRMNTNPFAVALPGRQDRPVVFDIATSATNQGRLKLAADSGQQVDPGLLLNRDGQPTTDPMDFYRGGAILPFGGPQGYKGYLLNFMVEVLGGILTGGGFMGHPIRQAGGQCMLVITLKVEAFRERAEFDREMDALIGYLKATRAQSGMEILAPGESSFRTKHQRRKEGILIPQATVAALQEELERYGTGYVLLR